MPHLRPRFALEPLKRLAKLWPVVGVVGLRQVGKSTLMRDLLRVSDIVTMDDDESRVDAENSPKVFLAKFPRPFVIDEIQKVPKLFDAIKSEIDKRRVPGSFYITGSRSFSSGELTRESLTGRVGTLRLFPMTLSEALGSTRGAPTLDDFVKGMSRGGLPVPMFLRDEESRRLYWDGWLETTLIRDLAQAYGRGYDLDIARLVIREIGQQLNEGEYPEISLFTKDSRKVAKYLQAMESIFLLNRIPCNTRGVGRDHWLLGDSGLASHVMGGGRARTEKMTLSLARHALYNEIAAGREYQLKRTPIEYFKSARGSVVDFVLDGLPMKVTVKSSGPLGWEEKGLLGAMKTLRSTRGLLLAPVERSDPPKKKGVCRASWLHFCGGK